MKLVMMIPAVLLLAACATQKPMASASAPAPLPPPAAAAAAQAPAEKVTIDATNIARAQAAGYKIVNEKGTKLYCRRSLITGTRLMYQTTCLTEEQMKTQEDAGRDAVKSPQLPYIGPPNGG